MAISLDVTEKLFRTFSRLTKAIKGGDHLVLCRGLNKVIYIFVFSKTSQPGQILEFIRMWKIL
jgi:hypothetical protein